MGTIGDDLAIPGMRGSPTVTLLPALFQACSVTFDPPFLNYTSTMIVTLHPSNAIGLDSSI
jgi:hypothetical protein